MKYLLTTLILSIFTCSSAMATNSFGSLMETDIQKAERCYQSKVNSLNEIQRKSFKRIGNLTIKNMNEEGVKWKVVVVHVETQPNYSVKTGLVVTKGVGGVRTEYPEFNLTKCK